MGAAMVQWIADRRSGTYSGREKLVEFNSRPSGLAHGQLTKLNHIQGYNFFYSECKC